MIIDCGGAGQVDTARLSPEERHIIQKLMAWASLCDSLGLFREKTAAALEAGWNESGPVTKTRALSLVIDSLEKKSPAPAEISRCRHIFLKRSPIAVHI